MTALRDMEGLPLRLVTFDADERFDDLALLRRDHALEAALRRNGIVSPLIEGDAQDRR